MVMFYIRVPVDLKEALAKIPPETLRSELLKITTPAPQK
jgi:hypothetical protein